MSRPAPRALALLPLAGLAVACKPQAPYSLTLDVQAKTIAQATSVDWRIIEGEPGVPVEPVEQKSVIGAGENVVIASQSSGRRTSSIVYEQLEAFNVVGESEADLPLVPGEQEEWSKVPVSVLKETVRTASWSSTTETFVNPTGDPTDWEEVSYADQQQVTDAGYYGVAADEYVVRMQMADMWDDLEEMEVTDVELMTRHEPQEGDVWPSVNGNSLYVYAGPETLTMAGVEMKKADKVEVYATGNVDPGVGNVFSQCLDIGLEQLQTSDPNIESTSLDRIFLDPGCTADFTHVQDGTQWWYDNVLVKAETNDIVVSVRDYGFEWYVEDETSGEVTRQTSLTRDEPSAKAFLEYTVTTTAVQYEVTSFTE